MIGDSLTAERVELPDGTMAMRYPWRGETVLVRDGAVEAMRMVEALSDATAPEERRRDEFLGLMFPDLADAMCACDWEPAQLAELAAQAAWDVLGVDLRGDRPCEEPVWDLEEDAARIRTSLRQAYGIDWDAERGRVSFAELVALIGGCPEDTPIGRAIHYRTRSTRPRPTKYNRKEVEAWDRAHRAYALHGRSSRGTDEGVSAAMDGAFAALRRAAL